MEDKTFELIERLYNRMEEGFKEIRSEMATKQDLARMEHENSLKFGALFDGLSANTEAITDLKVGMTANTEAITDLKAGMKANTEAITDLKAGMTANTEAINELKTEVKSLKKEVENHEIKLKLVK